MLSEQLRARLKNKRAQHVLTSRKKNSLFKVMNIHIPSIHGKLVKIVTMQSMAKVVAYATNCFVAKEEKDEDG